MTGEPCREKDAADGGVLSRAAVRRRMDAGRRWFSDCFGGSRRRSLVRRHRAGRETTPGDERDEARVGSKGIPFRIDRQVDEMDVAHGEGLVEPIEHRLALTETGMHQGHRIRRHVPLLGLAFQRSQHFSRFLRPAGCRKNVTLECGGLAVVSREPRPL